MNTIPGHIGRYELQELLGRDGVAEVWKAFDTQTHRYVAIKFLNVNLQVDPNFVTRFQRETVAIAALSHPNIVQYYDFSILQPSGTGSVTALMVMNYVDGGTLADYIRNTSRQGKFLPAADIVRLFTSIGSAVEYAHQRGVMHGQLKPTNVLLDKRTTSRNPMGDPVVTDFGILKLIGGVSDAAGSASGWRGGVPLYTAPEQITGGAGDARSDVYSLGIMLYEICAGTPPFQGNNPATVMMQHINTIPTLPALINPGLPAALTTIIMRCIAKDPWARFPTVASLVEALAQSTGQAEAEPSHSTATSTATASASQPDYAAKSMDMPTILSARQESLPLGMTPVLAPLSSPGISGASFSPPVSSITPLSAGQQAPALPALSSVQPTRRLSSGKPQRQTRWIVLAALVILALIGSGLGAYFVFFSKSASSTTTTPALAGHANFSSSGLLGPDTGSNQGITDQLQINLENISPPPTGKAYYAWLLNAKGKDWSPILLGPLTIHNGAADLFYPGDAAHSDLLASNSRFFITEEDAGAPPVNPSLSANALLYYAEFSQVPDPNNPKHYSLYDHIRHLLADDPKIVAAGLTGGLDIWLYRNTQSILGWANSARDAQTGGDAGFIHRQLIRIIDYLDGTFYNQQDIPGQGLLVDPTVAKIGLLTFDTAKQVNNPGYVYHISTHLHDLTILPQTSPAQKAIANQVYQALNVVNVWFHTLRDEVLQLYRMPAAQLFGSQGRTLLDSMATLANTAFVGQINAQGQVIDGVAQIHYAIQHLATFDVRACTTSNPCPSLAS